jgi:hypothetical protein
MEAIARDADPEDRRCLPAPVRVRAHEPHATTSSIASRRSGPEATSISSGQQPGAEHGATTRLAGCPVPIDPVPCVPSAAPAPSC